MHTYLLLILSVEVDEEGIRRHMKDRPTRRELIIPRHAILTIANKALLIRMRHRPRQYRIRLAAELVPAVCSREGGMEGENGRMAVLLLCCC